MKLEVGQVWTNHTGMQYSITRITSSTVYYIFKGSHGEYRKERNVYIDTFMRTINEHVGYFLLTELTKALI